MGRRCLALLLRQYPKATSRGSPENCSYLQSGHASRTRQVSSTVFPSPHGFPSDTRMFGFRSGSTGDVKTRGTPRLVNKCSSFVCPPPPGRDAGDAAVPLGGEFVGSFRRKCKQLYVNMVGTNIVFKTRVCTKEDMQYRLNANMPCRVLNLVDVCASSVKDLFFVRFASEWKPRSRRTTRSWF